MDIANNYLIERPAIYCRIFASGPQLNSLNFRSDNRWKQIGNFSWGLSLILCIVLSLVALIHKEVYYLLYVLLGPGGWLLAWGTLKFVQAIDRRSSQKKIRDERLVSRLDWLREQTKAGRLGRSMTDKGTAAWLMADGVYFNKSKYVPWNELTSFDMADYSPLTSEEVHQVTFRTRPRSTAFAFISSIIIFLMVLICIVIEAWRAVSGLRHFGIRDDLLALIFATLLNTVQLGYVMNSVKEFLGPSRRGGNKLVAVVDGAHISHRELQEFLRESLREV